MKKGTSKSIDRAKVVIALIQAMQISVLQASGALYKGLKSYEKAIVKGGERAESANERNADNA